MSRSKLETNVITGIHLAGKPKNAAGLALWKNKVEKNVIHKITKYLKAPHTTNQQ